MQQLPIRRIRPRVVTTTEAATHKPAMVVARRPAVPAAKTDAQVAADEVRDLLKSIAEADDAIDRAVEENNIAKARIDHLMRTHRIPSVIGIRRTAALVEKFSRQERLVDPKKFRARVAAETFWACTTVSLTRAAEFLGQKELDALCDITPGKSLGTVLEVKEPTRKRIK